MLRFFHALLDELQSYLQQVSKKTSNAASLSIFKAPKAPGRPVTAAASSTWRNGSVSTSTWLKETGRGAGKRSAAEKAENTSGRRPAAARGSFDMDDDFEDILAKIDDNDGMSPGIDKPCV